MADGRAVRSWVIGSLCALLALVAGAWLVVSAAFSNRPLDEYLEHARASGELVTFATHAEPAQFLHSRAAAEVTLREIEVVRAALEHNEADAAAGRARLDSRLAASGLARFPDAVRAERAWMLEAARRGEVNRLLFSKPEREGRSAFATLLEHSGAVARKWRDGSETVRGSPAELAHALAQSEPFATMPTDSYLRIAAALRAVPDMSSNRIVMAPIRTAASRAGRMEACCRLARVALAAAEHRAKHGDFPASLDELKPLFPDGVPLDPYTDAPFVYERTAAGVRIASLGRLAEDEPLDDAELRERCLVWELKR